MTEQQGIDNGAGVPVPLNEVLDHLDADGRKSFELAVARAQVARLQRAAQEEDQGENAAGT